MWIQMKAYYRKLIIELLIMGLREWSLIIDMHLSFVNLWTLAVDWMSVETFVAKTSLQNNM